MIKPVMESLNAKSIFRVIQNDHRIISQLDILNAVDSTNNYLLQQAKTAKPVAICLAESQTEGRGRQGKHWVSTGKNIYCSLLWHFPKSLNDISTLSLAAAVITLRAIERYHEGVHLQLKWPNDIYFAERKLGGILIEQAQLNASGHFAVVIGIGINLEKIVATDLTERAIALDEMIGAKIERNKMAGLLIDEMLTHIPNYIAHGNQPFLETFLQRDLLLNKYVVIRSAKYETAGIAQGITREGELLIRDERGRLQTFRSGEVSVKLR